VPDAGEDAQGFPRWAGVQLYPNTTLILDEAHYVKTSKSNRTRNVRALAGSCVRVWLLTGTPLLNRPPELWALLQACKWSGKRVFGSYEHFVYLFDGTRTKFGTVWGPNIKPEAIELLRRFMLRRTRQEVLPELPTKTYRDIVVPISKEALDGSAFRHLDAWSDEKVLEECEPNIGALASVRRELAEAKHAALVETIGSYEEVEEPLVVFSAHRACISSLRGRSHWGVITGDDSTFARAEAVKAFQDGHLKGLAGTIGAMGVGLTLTRSCHALFVDEHYVGGNNGKAQERFCRIGQKEGASLSRDSSPTTPSTSGSRPSWKRSGRCSKGAAYSDDLSGVRAMTSALMRILFAHKSADARVFSIEIAFRRTVRVIVPLGYTWSHMNAPETWARSYR
jgi:SWI/SNF-related matrix-associated actin-dependent regulator 1 of chromatin subfamily A